MNKRNTVLLFGKYASRFISLLSPTLQNSYHPYVGRQECNISIIQGIDSVPDLDRICVVCNRGGSKDADI